MKENSAEETIKTIEKMIKSYKQADECGLSTNDFKNEIKALEDILSDYKKIKEEFKAVDNECSRLEQKEVELEKAIDLMAKLISNIIDCPLESEGEDLDCEKMCGLRTEEECWKQYFKNKAKEVINK